MERNPVESSNIVSIGYDTTKATLEIEFKGGAVYQYDGIAPTVYEEIMLSSSPGKYFASAIRPFFAGRRMG